MIYIRDVNLFDECTYGTNVVVSMTDRSERDLNKHFDELDIGSPIIEKQLWRWDQLLRADKHLRVEVSFNFVNMKLSRA